MDDLIKLRDAIDRVAAELELRRVSYSVVPAEGLDGPYVQVAFEILPGIMLNLAEKEQRAFDESFSAIADPFKEPEEDPAQAELRRLAEEAMGDDI
jgi:hypothetical protein